MAIICPPDAAPSGEQTGAGWKVSRNRRGTYIGKKGTPHYTGLKSWCLESANLGGHTLWQAQKDYLRFLANFWKTGYPEAHGYTDANGAAFPFTNLNGIRTTHNGFELWMHIQRTYCYTNYTPPFPAWAAPYYGNWFIDFDPAITEDNMPPPVITSASINENLEYSLTITNWDVSYFPVYSANIMITVPGVGRLSPHHLLTIDVVAPNPFPAPWVSTDISIPQSLIKKLPVGATIMLGARGNGGGYYNGVLPCPLGAELVTVDPA
jgi:hypothetical protein